MDDAAPAPLRAWRCDTGWLVWRGPAASPVPDGLGLRRVSGQPLPDPPGDYWLFGDDGKLARACETMPWSVEDELGASAFVVTDGELVEIVVVSHPRHDPVIRETVVARGLQPVGDGDGDARRSISDAIARELEKRARREEKSARMGRDRVASIPGALETYEGAGDDFHRAHESLRNCLAAFFAPTYASLLHALMLFGARHRGASGEWRAALEWAMEPYVAACRIAANAPQSRELRDRAWETEPGGHVVPPAQRPHARELAGALRRVHADLLQAAGWADDTDARNTAIQYRQAAAAVDASRARLEAASVEGSA
ncbi:MAG TPA: hypothetical protein VF092_28645 [Longimicrobium sp.]